MSKCKVVRPQSKGMVTIPKEYREALGIDEDSLLEVQLIDNGVQFIKVTYTSEPAPGEVVELFSDKEISEWKRNDKLDGSTIKKLA
ncbi:MAG: AbrB/MazE/SpoVT family DNA-binding domain-containing protein [Candidatus Peregrinibacteria bacterium]|nr:AbrB/MazE/SpoVT family DNA-binding domain-containing protein [Candidatus Peregrinibacteria bacterium]MDZ4245123.1 AbrB/MazE/SpoVT family DNA-binding domain-containing protein [Candidatus Gracilibacteria bacterium]